MPFSSTAWALSLALSYAALVGLCLGMERHCIQVLGRGRPAAWRRGLRIFGWVALAASFFYAGRAWGWAVGPVAWCGQLSLLALLLAFLLPYRPRSACLAALPALAAAWAACLY